MSASSGSPIIRAPSHAKKGEIIEVRSLVRSPMTTGFQKNKQGQIIPAHFIQTVTVTFNGKPVSHFDFGTAISKDPYLAFRMRAEQSGTLKMVWKDNKGGRWSAKAHIAVT